MRKGNMTRLASTLTIMLVAMAAGAGTMAYFSETATVNPTFASGDPDIQISVNGGSWSYGPVAVSTPVGWAPGDSDFTLTIKVRNIGDSGLLIGGMGGSNPSGDLGLADKIEITLLDATEFTETDYMGIPIAYWQGVFDGGAPLTLAEFVTSPYSAKFWEGGHPPTSDYLDAGGGDVKEMKIVFHFMEDADNSYQGLTYSFDLEITGTDDPAILGEG